MDYKLETPEPLVYIARVSISIHFPNVNRNRK